MPEHRAVLSCLMREPVLSGTNNGSKSCPDTNCLLCIDHLPFRINQTAHHDLEAVVNTLQSGYQTFQNQLVRTATAARCPPLLLNRDQLPPLPELLSGRNVPATNNGREQSAIVTFAPSRA